MSIRTPELAAITREVKLARWATYALLFTNGFVSASWIVHAPNIIKQAGLNAAQFGLAASAVGIGSVLVIPFAGYFLAKAGVRVTTRWAYVAFGVALTILAFAPNFGIFLAGLLVGGSASAIVESCGSTSGSRIEHLYKKSMMPGFIGAMSAGGILGSLLGGAALEAGIPMQAHLIFTGVLVVAVGLSIAPSLLSPKIDPTVGKTVRARPKFSLRLVLVSLVVLVSICEGASFSFATVYMTEELGTTASYAALAVTAHTVGTAAAQLSGDWLRTRFSAANIVRVFVFVGGAVMAAALFSHSPVLTLIGFAAFGASVAFVYPASLSAAADTQATPAPGIAVAQTVRYAGTFGAAPLLGMFADSFGLTEMFLGTIIFSVVLILALSGTLGSHRGLPVREGGELPGLRTTGAVGPTGRAGVLISPDLAGPVKEDVAKH